jgi:predicted membrane protein
MWRDVLLIVGTAATVLMFFGLTPRRLSGYAKSAKYDIAKKSPRQKFYLVVAIVVTPFYVFFAIWEFETIGLVTSLMFVSLVLILWGGTLTRVWKLSEKGRKVANGVMYAGFAAALSLVITAFVLSDIPLWHKLAESLGGVAGGYGMHRLSTYLRKKDRERERLSQTPDRESPL